jgi:hypothetical protein
LEQQRQENRSHNSPETHLKTQAPKRPFFKKGHEKRLPARAVSSILLSSSFRAAEDEAEDKDEGDGPDKGRNEIEASDDGTPATQ